MLHSWHLVQKAQMCEMHYIRRGFLYQKGTEHLKIPIYRGVCVKRKHLVGNDLRVVTCHLSYIFRNGT